MQVFFDLKTSSRYKNVDILQIAVGEEIFSVYIELTQAIDSDANQVNGLENRDGVLFFCVKKCYNIVYDCTGSIL